ncbi:MAG: hypothetical protein SGILL_003631, partial [Bacillariaceae sp.]
LDGAGGLSNRGMRKGNAVVAHNDGNRLIATADDGSLHIVQTAPRVQTLAVFEPPGVVDKFTECRSGATIVYPELVDVDSPGESFSSIREGLDEEYVVYAVVDAAVTSNVQFDEAGFVQPSSNEDGSATSRVMAVTMNGRLKWSVPVPGRIQGDVVVGTAAIYVSHNIRDTGFVSVIMTDEDQSSAEIVATLTSSDDRNGPFTGAALQQNSEVEVGDVILVAESWGQGYDETQGGLFMLSPTSDFEDNGGRGNDSYELQRISSWPSSAFAPPLVSGDSVFLGAAGANFAAWTGNQRNDLSGITSGRVDEIDPRFVYQMPTNQRNASQRKYSEYVLEGGTLRPENGRSVWAEVTDSEVMARPLIWEDDSGSVVYSVESRNGRIRQYDLYTGEIYWDYSCADINGLGGLCQASVEAEFAIAPSGNIVYYGDIFGRIVSLEIANFATDAPTDAPTGFGTEVSTEDSTEEEVGGTTVPVDNNEETPLNPGEGIVDGGDEGNDGESSIFDVVEENPDSLTSEQQAQQGEEEDSSSNIGIYVGAALGGLCVLLVPFVVFSLMRSRREKKQASEMHVEIIDDCDDGDEDYAKDLEGQDYETGTDQSSFDGIEIQYTGAGVKSAPVTPVKRKKKKKRKKSPMNTPQTAATLESIEELPEEATASNAEDVEIGIESVNLVRKFDMVAYSSSSSGSSSDSQSSGDRSESSSPVSTGDVGVASGTNHLELVVGETNNRSLTGLNTQYKPDKDDVDTSDDEDTPPPPPPNTPLQSSSQKWSWGSLLQMGSSNSVKKQEPTQAAKETPSSSTQEITLRPVSTKETKEKEETKILSAISPNPSIDELSRAETPPVSNQGALSPVSTQSNEIVEDERQLVSPASWPSASDMSPTPDRMAENRTEVDASKVQHQEIAMIAEEEKKDDDEDYGKQLSNAVESAYNALSPGYFFAESLDDPAHDPRRSLSPNEQSQNSGQIHSPISPTRCESVLSTDDSLYTSATGVTGGKADDESNLSPLSTSLFDRDILRKERSDIPMDEAQASLSPPDLSQPEKDRFRYLDDESVPEDEIIPAPGFQYMASQQDKSKVDKYGKSVRSKKDSFRNQPSKTTTQDSADAGDASPLTAIYNQLASMGQQKVEEKRKHTFKRRSKRMEREPTPDPSPEEQLEESGDTWSSFLEELAEAEQQFFAPKASLLQTGDSDSEDSEIARINKV